MTRIISGTFRGRRLQVPAKGTRPTSDRVREAVFSRLEHEDAVSDARVLDLYAGSGALGLEAMSRGASHLTLVDSARSAIAVMKRNVAELGLASKAVAVVQDDAARFAARAVGPGYDLVFLDPPYDLPPTALAQTLEHLTQPGTLAPQAVVVVEQATRNQPPPWPPELTEEAAKTYGETKVYFLTMI